MCWTKFKYKVLLKLKYKLDNSELSRFKNRECWRNYKFCKKYPFMKSRNVWSGKFTGYEFTWYDNIPEGWRKAFGQQMLDEICKACNYDKKIMKQISWSDIKEKYGELRLYATAPDVVQAILEKYEYLSRGYCIYCGKPAKYETSGWISYECEDCFKNGFKYEIGAIKEDENGNKTIRELTPKEEVQYSKYESKHRLSNLYKLKDFKHTTSSGYGAKDSCEQEKKLGIVWHLIKEEEEVVDDKPVTCYTYELDEKASYGTTIQELWGIKK